MTDDKRRTLQALSQDLTRVAMGRYRGQTKMADSFAIEAKKRLAEYPDFVFADQILHALDSRAERSAEDLLMYATLTRNRASVVNISEAVE